MKGKDGASVQEIVSALSRGGLELNSAQESDLRIGLSRSTLDLSKVKDDYYCLLEFLPHIKRGKKGRKTADSAQMGLDDASQEQEEKTETAGKS